MTSTKAVGAAARARSSSAGPVDVHQLRRPARRSRRGRSPAAAPARLTTTGRSVTIGVAGAVEHVGAVGRARCGPAAPARRSGRGGPAPGVWTGHQVPSCAPQLERGAVGPGRPARQGPATRRGRPAPGRRRAARRPPRPAAGRSSCAGRQPRRRGGDAPGRVRAAGRPRLLARACRRSRPGRTTRRPPRRPRGRAGAAPARRPGPGRRRRRCRGAGGCGARASDRPGTGPPSLPARRPCPRGAAAAGAGPRPAAQGRHPHAARPGAAAGRRLRRAGRDAAVTRRGRTDAASPPMPQ